MGLEMGMCICLPFSFFDPFRFVLLLLGPTQQFCTSQHALSYFTIHTYTLHPELMCFLLISSSDFAFLSLSYFPVLHISFHSPMTVSPGKYLFLFLGGYFYALLLVKHR